MPDEKKTVEPATRRSEWLGGMILVAIAAGAGIVLFMLFPRESPGPEAPATILRPASELGECHVDRQPAAESAIGLAPPEWLKTPLAEWRVLDASTGTVLHRIADRWDPQLVPPGRYKIRFRQHATDGMDVTLPQVVEVRPKEVARVKVCGGVKPEPADWVPLPFQWGLVGKKGRYLQFESGRWDPLLMPPGIYGLAIQALPGSPLLCLVGEVGVSESGLTPVKIASGLKPEPVKWTPAARWWAITDSSDRPVLQVEGAWHPVALPPGCYNLIVQPALKDSLPVLYVSKVEVGKADLAPVPLDTGIAIRAESWVPVPYAWRVSRASGGDVQVCKGGWQKLLVPPGKYDVRIQPEAGSASMSYMNDVVVKAGRLVVLAVDTGIEIEPAGWMSPPAAWTVYDSEGKTAIQRRRGTWGCVVIPPGKYLIGVQPESYNKEIMLPGPVEAPPGRLTKAPLRCGIRIRPPAGAQAPCRWDVIDAQSQKSVQFVTGRWGATLVPPGAYDVTVQLQASGPGAKPVTAAKAVVVAPEKCSEIVFAPPGSGKSP